MTSAYIHCYPPLRVQDVNTHLLGDHVDIILDPAVRDHRKDGGVNDSQPLYAMDFQILINNTLTDLLGQTAGSAGIQELSAMLNGIYIDIKRLSEPSL